MALKENYKDDILDVSVNTKRKYRMTENADGTISLDDETVYTQEGDSFGASDLNAMAHAINNTSSDAEHTSYDNTESGLTSDNVQGAIDEINDNLTAKVTKFSGTDSGNTYVTVDGLAYDATNKKLGLKVNGADTVIPFSGDDISIYDMGWTAGYGANATINKNITLNGKKYVLHIFGAGGRSDSSRNAQAKLNNVIIEPLSQNSTNGMIYKSYIFECNPGDVLNVYAYGQTSSYTTHAVFFLDKLS